MQIVRATGNARRLRLNVRKSIRRQPKWAEMVCLEMPFGHFYVHKYLRMITGSPVGLANGSQKEANSTLDKPQKAVSKHKVSTRLFVYIVAEIRGILGQGRCKREGIKRWWE